MIHETHSVYWYYGRISACRRNAQFIINFHVLQVSLTVSLRYASREQTIKRTLSAARGGVFGVKISHVTRYIMWLLCGIVSEVYAILIFFGSLK